MTGQEMSKAELLAAIDQGWNRMQNYLASLQFEQVIVPTDAAGWTAKDHLAHLAAWEDSINALLEKKPRPEHMGLTREQYETGDYDMINAIIRQQHRDIGLMELREWFFGVHARLVEKVNGMTDEELQRPYNEYQPESAWTDPVIRWIKGNTYEHFAEHTEYIERIVSGWALDKAQLLAQAEQGWAALQDYLNTLSDAQLTRQTDAAGWTIKDHLMHLAVWEDGVLALLEGESRPGRMGLTKPLFEGGDFDAMNAVIREQYKELSLSEVKARFDDIHQRLLKRVEALSDEELQRPYSAFDPTTTWDQKMLHSIAGNSHQHYSEHLPWMRAIAASGK